MAQQDPLNTPIFIDATGNPTVGAGYFQGSDGQKYAVPTFGTSYSNGPPQKFTTLRDYQKPQEAPERPLSDEAYDLLLSQQESPQVRAIRDDLRREDAPPAEAPPQKPSVAAKAAPAKAATPKGEAQQAAPTPPQGTARGFVTPNAPAPPSYQGRPLFGTTPGAERYPEGTVMGIPYPTTQTLWNMAPWNPNGYLDAFAKGLGRAANDLSGTPPPPQFGPAVPQHPAEMDAWAAGRRAAR